MTIGLFTPSRAYKPFRYPWAFEAWQTHERIHWLVDEIPLADDVKDWNGNLSPAEKNLVTQIFRLFTQADVDVEGAYLGLYIPAFKPFEIRMMLSGFAARENIHAVSYSTLLDTIGIPETEYAAFLEYEEMAAKHDYLKQFDMNSPYNAALSMAVFAGFTEGLQLFASFAMLLNFARFNKMKGMCQVVNLSVKDETAHVAGICKLFHTLLSECPEIDREALHADILRVCGEIVDNEDRFIDLAFEMGPVEGLAPDDMKGYIRWVANMRLSQLGVSALYDVSANPLPWLDDILNAVEHANFFENRPTEYSRAATGGDWGDVF